MKSYVLAVLLLIAFLTLKIQLPINAAVSGSWYSAYDDWGYRKEFNVTGSSSGNQTDYEIPIVCEYESGVDSGNTVYLNNHAQTDFKDVRFTEWNGTHENPVYYWNQTTINSDQATFWFKAETLSNLTTNTFYVYYGNAFASYNGVGFNTFVRWDDFDLSYSLDDDLNATRGWSVTGTNNSNNYVKIKADPDTASNQVVRIEESGDSVYNVLTMGLPSTMTSFRVFCRQMRGQDRTWYWDVLESGTQRISVALESTYDRKRFYNGSYREFDPQCPTLNVDQWYNFSDVCNMDNVYPDLHVMNISTTRYTGNLRSTPTNGFTDIRYINLATQAGTLYLDEFFVTKYVVLQPYVSAWGNEETHNVRRLTIYRTVGGIMRLDNATIANGTYYDYPNGTFVEFEIIALVEGNNTYTLSNWTYGATVNYSNPYDFSETLTANLTLWLYFGTNATGGVAPTTVGVEKLFTGLIFLGVMISLPLILVLRKKELL